jgi:hypothetical protein
VKNGGRNQEHRAATGRQGSATGRPGADLVTFWAKWKERKGEIRENLGDLWCLGLVNAENGKV